MPTYVFKGRNRMNEIVMGERVADNREALRQIEAAEAAIKALGFSQVRVRHHGDVARIEVEPNELARLVSERARIVAALQSAGYRFVSLDLEGYATGSLNRTWKPAGN